MTKNQVKTKEDKQVEHIPTVEEAQAMFEANAGLFYVVTTKGGLSRSGELTPL